MAEESPRPVVGASVPGPVPPVPSPDAVEAALAALDDLDALPTGEHVARLEAAHDALVAELARSED
ncbi:hypothetical protein [Cellulosimicrobium marinum]|uniref:hypothetical protein n=1 Tax=Cellulosimicrobium marinum TaxID=1638992 RepID=UPI001E3EEE8E|nr:hypothetical protein [Cellulosimicrobium marinum]MCB7138164.1 hypothetical protein [Cellulosimicrobium marinum]